MVSSHAIIDARSFYIIPVFPLIFYINRLKKSPMRQRADSEGAAAIKYALGDCPKPLWSEGHICPAPVLFSWSGGQGLGRVAQSQHHYHPDLLWYPQDLLYFVLIERADPASSKYLSHRRQAHVIHRNGHYLWGSSTGHRGHIGLAHSRFRESLTQFHILHHHERPILEVAGRGGPASWHTTRV